MSHRNYRCFLSVTTFYCLVELFIYNALLTKLLCFHDYKVESIHVEHLQDTKRIKWKYAIICNLATPQ